MFNPGIAAIENVGKQREAVGAAVRDMVSSETFTYTELLSSQEPFRSFALEILDGVTVNGSVPNYGSAHIEDWGGKPFRLIHVNPNGRITLPEMRSIRIPGSNKTKTEKHWKDIGNIADVYDHPHNRQARFLLHSKGWPVRQTITNGNAIGEIVEWQWLVQEAAKGAQALPDVVELHAEISKRIEAWEAQQLAGMKVAAEKSNQKAPAQRA